MADLLRQGIYVNDNKDPTPQEMYVPENTPLPQLEEEDIWIPEGFIWTRRSNNLHNTYADFKNYSGEEVINMKKLELFLILFYVEYVNIDTHTPPKKLLKSTMNVE